MKARAIRSGSTDQADRTGYLRRTPPHRQEAAANGTSGGLRRRREVVVDLSQRFDGAPMRDCGRGGRGETMAAYGLVLAPRRQ